MPSLTGILPRLKRYVLYSIKATIGVFAMISLALTLAFIVTYYTQPSDKEILMKIAPHDSAEKRVWRIPTKERRQRLPVQREV